MTANACPCGQTGRERGVCFCSGVEVRRYWDRIGTPLMDRIDLRVFVTPEAPDRLLDRPSFHPAAARQRIAQARERQRERGQNALATNAALAPQELEAFCGLTPGGRKLLTDAGRLHDWSSRALHSLLRVARTLADLVDEDTVREDHVEAAIALRKPQGEEYWER
jgi:magnesium chelatase family protein